MAFKKGQSGNPKGRPKGTKNRMTELQDAMKSAAKENEGKTILQHFVERAYENDQVLVALVKKLMPDLKQTDVDAVIAGAIHQSSSKKVPEKIQELVERVIENRSE